MSTPIYVECDKMYRSKVCVQEFWYCVPGLDIQAVMNLRPIQDENPSTTFLYELQVAKYDESYTVFFMESRRIYDLLVKMSSRKSGYMGSILEKC